MTISDNLMRLKSAYCYSFLITCDLKDNVANAVLALHVQ